MALSRVDNKFITSLEGSKLFGDFPASPQIDGAALTGIEGVDLNSRYNLALNYFGDSVRNNKDRLSLDQGWIDTFEDASDVAGEGRNVPMTTFDGTVNFLNRTTGQGNMSNMANGKECLFSCYYKSNQDGAGGTSDHDLFAIGNNNHILIRKDGFDSTNKINVYMVNTSNALVGRYKNSKTITIADGIVHILVAVKMDAASAADKCKIIITTSDGTKHTTMEEITPASDSTLGFGVACPVVGGGGGALSGSIGNSGLRGSLGQVYFALEHMDIAVNANYSKFYNTHASLKDFGTDGSLPTGNTPPIYLNNPYDTFQNNLGSGGDFNENGTLEDGGYIGDYPIYSSESFTNAYELIDSYGKENANADEGFGRANNGGEYIGQSITLSSATAVSKLGFMLKEQASAPSTLVHPVIMGVTGTVGTNADGDETDIKAFGIGRDLSSIGTTFSHQIFDFSETVFLPAGDYWFGLYTSMSEVNNYLRSDLRTNGTSASAGNFSKRDAGSWEPSVHAFMMPYYLYGQKNLDLITKGSDDIGNSPSAAPDTGHMEILMTERPASGTSAYSLALTGNVNGNMNYTYRLVVPSLSAGGNRIRVKLQAHATQRCDIDNVAIGYRSGATANCTAVPVEILFGGTSGVVIPSGGTVWSDWVDFPVNTTTQHLVIIDVGSTSVLTTGLGYNFTTAGEGGYQTPNGNSYNTAAGLTQTITSNQHWGLAEIEVSVPQVLNTDIIAKMSRNGGTDYSNVTLTRTKTQVMGTDYNMLVGEADFTDGDATGTNIIGKIYTANKDKITVTGVSVNWK